MNAPICRITAFATTVTTACILAAGIVGCATSSAKLDRVSLGMSREEVVKTLGRPHAVSAQGDVEFLTYNLVNKGVGDMKEFVVRIQQGSVESFGERVSFGASLFGTNAPAGATAK
ncbi:MAG: outer membrane protein assembly factor BamE [Verrucomicrobiota bacterium]